MAKLVAFVTTIALLAVGLVLIASGIAPALGAVCWMASLASLSACARIVNDEREAAELESLNAEYASMKKELW